MSDGKDPLGILTEEPKATSDPLGILGEESKKKSSSSGSKTELSASPISGGETPSTSPYETGSIMERKPLLTPTVEEVKKTGQKPSWENYLSSARQAKGILETGEKPLEEPIESYVGKHTEQTLEGAKQFIQSGGQLVGGATGLDKPQTWEQATKSALGVVQGAANMVFGGLSFTPAGAAFNVGAEALPENVQKVMFTPVSSLAKQFGYEPKSDLGKQVFNVLDLGGSILEMHGLGKTYKTIKSKYDKGEQVTPEEAKPIKDAIDTATPEELHKAFEENGYEHPDLINKNTVIPVVEKAKEGENVKKDIAKLDVDKPTFENVVNTAEQGQHLSPEKAKELKQVYEHIQNAKESVPEEHRNNPKIISLIADKNELLYAKKATDKVFHEPIDKKIEAIDNKIKTTLGLPIEEKSVAKEEKPKEKVEPKEVSPIKTEEVPEGISKAPELRTWELGDLKGTKQDAKAVDDLNDKIVNHPDEKVAGGESFNEFSEGRVVPFTKNLIESAKDNSVVVTHNSVFGLIKQLKEDYIDKGEQIPDKLSKEFRERYTTKDSEPGDSFTIKSGDKEIHVVRHGETEDNVKKVFRTDETPLTEDGKKHIENVADKFRKEGIKPSEIITSDLPRAVETAKGIQKGTEGVHEATGFAKKLIDNGWFNATGEKGEQRLDLGLSTEEVNRAIEHIKAGKDTQASKALLDKLKEMQDAGELKLIQGSGGNTVKSGVPLSEVKFEEKAKPEEPPIEPPTSEEEPPPMQQGETVGISHEAQKERAKKMGAEEPERGEGITAEEAIKRGKDLIKEGADADKVAEEFKKNGKISADDLSIVRARHEELTKETNKIVEKYGDDSPEAKEALKKENDWYKNVVKPMQTEWSKIGMVQQGEVDIDTGSYIGLRRAFQERTGRTSMTVGEVKQAKELADKVKALTDEVDGLKKKLTEVIDNAIKEEKEPKRKITSERKEKLKQSISDRLARLSNVKFAVEDADRTNVITEITGLIKDIAELGGLEFVDAVKNAIEKLPHLKDFIDKNKDDIEKEFNKPEHDLFTRFADKTDSEFTPQDVKDIWTYAKKEYLDKGRSFGETIGGVSTDLGLSQEQVYRALTKPKGAKVITDEMYRKQNRRTEAVNRAKRWVSTADTPKLLQVIKAIPNVFFAAKVFGHGTVGMITHAGMNIFRPTAWGTYFPNFFKQFNYAFGGLTKKGLAKYEREMDFLVNDPDYIKWKRAGLAVDPAKATDDYQTFKNYFGGASKIGDRGFNALKVFRFETAQNIYNGLSEVERSDPNTIKEIAKIVNNATGTSKIQVPEIANTAFFAPRLEASRWARLITQPAKAVSTFYNWDKATPAEKAAAKIVSKRAGEMLATYAALLAVNQGLLSATGSKDKINFTDPSKADWLKFKGGGKMLDVTGGMRSTFQFVTKLLEAAIEPQKELHGKKRFDIMKSLVGDYVRGKFSPFLSTATDVATQADFRGRPLPFSKDKPKSGEKKYTWFSPVKESYLLQQQTPIPIAAAIQDVAQTMKDRGMSNVDIQTILGGIGTGLVEGGTGARMSDIPKKKKR